MPVRPQLRCLFALLLAGSGMAQSPSSNALTAVRFWTLSDTTRVVLETTAEFEYKWDRVAGPDRIFFDLADTEVRLGKKRHGLITVGDQRLKQIRVAETQRGVARIVFDLGDNVEYTASRLTNPSRLIVELRTAKSSVPLLSSTPGKYVPPEPDRSIPEPVLTDAAPALSRSASAGQNAQAPAISPGTRPSVPPPPKTAPEPLLSDATPGLPKQTASAANAPVIPKSRTAVPPPPAPARMDTDSMTRVLGLKIGRIVLDAGHGGHDTGTIGPGGLYEKDMVLDIAKRLGTLIENRLHAEVVYTRSDDTFIPLERRTEIANEKKADLFLSIHANSSPERTTSGVETYFLNFTDNKSALALAARENAGSGRTVYDLRDLLQKIALHDKIEESRQFAARVQESLYAVSAKANSRTRDRGVRKAPFVVLIGASMPSVLAEVGFVTNPKDEALFRRGEMRQKIAEGLFGGISGYAATLSRFQVAQK